MRASINQQLCRQMDRGPPMHFSLAIKHFYRRFCWISSKLKNELRRNRLSFDNRLFQFPGFTIHTVSMTVTAEEPSHFLCLIENVLFKQEMHAENGFKGTSFYRMKFSRCQRLNRSQQLKEQMFKQQTTTIGQVDSSRIKEQRKQYEWPFPACIYASLQEISRK